MFISMISCGLCVFFLFVCLFVCVVVGRERGEREGREREGRERGGRERGGRERGGEKRIRKKSLGNGETRDFLRKFNNNNINNINNRELAKIHGVENFWTRPSLSSLSQVSLLFNFLFFFLFFFCFSSFHFKLKTNTILFIRLHVRIAER